PGFVVLPATTTTILRDTVSPAEDMLLSAGDTVRVAFQGSPLGNAEFNIEGVAHHIPMIDNNGRGVYEGSYVIQPGQIANRAAITVILKKRVVHREVAKGRLSIETGGTPRVGWITEDTVAARTGTEGGYDIFLYKGMRVRLTGKAGG